MKSNSHAGYAVAALVTIALGIGIRKFLPGHVSKIPGDALYAVMVYWIVRAAKPAMSTKHAALIAIALSFIVECLKLLRFHRLVAFRGTFVGHLIFGSVFSTANLACYVLGVAIAWFVDREFSAPSRARGDRR